MFGKKKTIGRHSAEHVNRLKQESEENLARINEEKVFLQPDDEPVYDIDIPEDEKPIDAVEVSDYTDSAPDADMPKADDNSGNANPEPEKTLTEAGPSFEDNTQAADLLEESGKHRERAPEKAEPEEALETENMEPEAQTHCKTEPEENSLHEKQGEDVPEEAPAEKEKAKESEPEQVSELVSEEEPEPVLKAEDKLHPSEKMPAAGEAPVRNEKPTVQANKRKEGKTGKAKKTADSKGSGPSVPAMVICALLIVSILFITLIIIKLNVLPLNLLIAAVLILAGLAFICVALTWSTKKPVLFAVGAFFSLLLLAGLAIGSYAMKRAWDTAQKVTSASVSMAEVGVYVNAGDKATKIEDLGGYTFGVLKTQDRDDANKALLDIATDLNLTIYVAEYDNVIKLISALYKGQIQAAVVETYHIEMLASMENEEFTEIASLVRMVGSYEVESTTSEFSYEMGDLIDSPLKKEDTTPVEQGYVDHTFCIYVSGIDSYGAVNVKSRSDVNVLAFINDKTHQIFLVSTPRDYYVYTPVSGNQRDKLTHAGLWGPECSMGTLSNLYNCDVDYFFRINFSGFIDVVDALGGLDVEIWDGYPKVHLNGEDALLIARDRHSIGGEVNRGDRHMRIITAVINQVLSTDILYNYNDVLDAVSDSFDTSVPYDLISRIVKEQIESNPSWEIIRYTVSGYGTSDLCYSLSVYDETGGYAYVLVPNNDTVQTVHDLVRAMERNERISDPNA